LNVLGKVLEAETVIVAAHKEFRASEKLYI
jgi:hypothetical protein